MPRRAGPSAYLILWSQVFCASLQRDKDKGPFAVLYGGPLRSLPSVKSLQPGDRAYPVSLVAGQIRLIARMRIAEIIPIDRYERPNWRTYRGHHMQHGCIDHVALGESGTLFSFDRTIPPETVAALRLGPNPEAERPLKHFRDGRMQHAIGLQGCYRRLSDESAGLLDSIIGSDAPGAPLVHDSGMFAP